MSVVTRPRVGIVSTGARTPVGLDAPSTAAAVRAGLAVMAKHPFMLDKKAEPMVVCADALLPITLTGVDRLLNLALPAAREALQPLREDIRGSLRIAVFLALSEERPGREEHLERSFMPRFVSGLAHECTVGELVCHPAGHAGGLLCIEQAMSFIASGASDVCLVGGVESYFEAETLEWLDDTDQLHSESTIWGFCPGEGAAFCLLASERAIARLGLSVPIEVLSAGSARELNTINTDTVCVGQGLSEAFNKTLAGLRDDRLVNHTICDMNGEPYRGNEYGFAMLRSPGKFADDAHFQTPADCCGDMGAASGPLFVSLAAHAAMKGYGPGPLTLLWASSYGGLRAAAVLYSGASPMTS
jgi:3-oxoacyl-[acyl-carrier-protein] synthase I